ncbi:NAD(P)-binding protein [Poronia punctata]|nr:NAD(P)-binding protein [Poronia punctata]
MVSSNNSKAVEAFTSITHKDTYPFISPEKTNLSGKSVFIAGASKGIGRETALAFAQAGCSRIAIGARSDLSPLVQELEKAAKDAGKAAPHVISLQLDVTSEDSVRASADKISQQFGGALDILICNAGYLENWVPLAESDPTEWWSTWNINIKGTYMLNRFFIPLLLKSETKTSIVVSSYGALNTVPSASSYQTTKFAVCRLTEFIATEYAAQGLICFATHPGGILTKLASNIPKQYWDFLSDELPLPAHTFVWLSRERRPWLNGRFMSVTWDMEELEKKKDQIVEKDLLKFRMTI